MSLYVSKVNLNVSMVILHCCMMIGEPPFIKGKPTGMAQGEILNLQCEPIVSEVSLHDSRVRLFGFGSDPL